MRGIQYSIAAAIILIGSSSCSSAMQPPTITPTQSQPTQVRPTPPRPPTTLPPSPVPSATEPVPVPIGIDTLSPSGPWILLTKSSHLWLADTLGGIRDLGQANLWGADPVAISHSMDYLSALTQDEESPRLQIISIPDGPILCDTPLVAPSLATDSDAWKAIWSPFSIAWSPASNLIALVAALDAPTTDVYTLDPSSCRPRRITSGEFDAYGLHWSPDGRHIVQTAGYLGTGAGDYVDAVWASRSDGSGNEYLYPGPPAEEARYRDRTGGEWLQGWLGPTTFLVTTWDASWGDRDLRSFDIATKARAILWPDRIDQIAFDPASHTILLSNTYGPNPPMFPNDSGLYLLYPARSPQLVTPDVGFGGRITWFAEPGLFVAQLPRGYMSVEPNATTTELPAPALDCHDPLPSPNGQFWAWQCATGVMVSGSYSQSLVAHPGQASAVFWSPDSTRLFVIDESQDGPFVTFDTIERRSESTAAGLGAATIPIWPPAWIQ